jgi:hypothetical protein
MIRRLGVLVLGLALALGSCGRQITPDSALGINGNGLVSGTMQITFRTVGALDFTNVGYWIVFNTSGNQLTPYPQFTLNPQNYSYALVVGAAQGGVFGVQSSIPELIQYYLVSGAGSPLHGVVIQSISSTQLRSVLPGNGSANQFTVTFDRSIFNQAPPTEACTTGTVTPSPSPGATATASPSASASASPSPSATITASGSPTPSAVATPCGQASNLWAINFFTTDPSGNPLDSLGLLGAKDNQYQNLKVDVTTAFDLTQQLTRQPGSTTASNPAAAIAGGEIINAP